MTDTSIDHVIAEAAAVWPGVAVAPDRLAAFVAERDGGRELRADLVLACACLDGDATALALFEDRLLAPVAARLARTGVGAADETISKLRATLFVAEPGAQPRLASYSGRGELRGWLEVVATREAYKLNRHTPIVCDNQILASLPDDDDLELRHIKTQHKVELQRAFADALATLPRRERLLLRQRYLDGLTFDAVAALHSVHRITVMRWFARIEKALLVGIRQLLMERLRLQASEVRFLVEDARSRLDLSLHGLLGMEATVK